MISAVSSVTSIETAFGAKEITSSAMRDAITDWAELYEQQDATADSDPCQRIPYVVVTKITRAALAEYAPSCDAEYGKVILAALDTVKQEAMHMALIGGEALIKPVPTETGWQMRVIPRDAVCVFGRDGSGRMTDIATCEYSAHGKCYYTLMERRKVDMAGMLTITNRLYKSYDSSTLGSLCGLAEVEEYAELADEITLPQPVYGLGLIPVRTPMANCVDRSRDAVSVYAPAVGLINNINTNEAQINGEFSRGESRVFVSSDLVKKRNGVKSFDDHLFVKLDGDPEETGVTIFNPQLRDASFLARKTEYLRNVETVIGLKRGILGEVEAAERTATEVTSSAGDYNLTIIDFQQMWDKAVRETVAVCCILGHIYKVPGCIDVDPDTITIDWGNGVLYDEDKTWADYLAMVASGMIRPEIALGWRFGLPTETPADLQKIRDKYMPELDSLAMSD